MINRETVDYIMKELIPFPAVNNLAARIDVLFRYSEKGSLVSFKDELIYSIRKIARKNKKIINNDTMIKIEECADYFESFLVAEKLDNKR